MRRARGTQFRYGDSVPVHLKNGTNQDLSVFMFCTIIFLRTQDREDVAEAISPFETQSVSKIRRWQPSSYIQMLFAQGPKAADPFSVLPGTRGRNSVPAPSPLVFQPPMPEPKNS